MLKTFMIKCSIEGLEKSIMPEDMTYAYVICFTRDARFENAARRVVEHLRQDGLVLKEIIEPINVLHSPWSTLVHDNWPEYAKTLIDDKDFEAIMGNSGVVYSPFAGY